MTAVEDHQDDMVAIMDSLGEDYPESGGHDRRARPGTEHWYRSGAAGATGNQGEAEHAPAGKHAGLSLLDLPLPARPAAYLT